jgi:type II secretory pathway pseudopilin PulG
MLPYRRLGYSLLELLVVGAILGILLGLILPAVFQVRAAVLRHQCASNLRQLGLALHHYHDSHKAFPPGVRIRVAREPFPFMGWQARLLPYLEQQALWQQVQRDYRTNRFPFRPPLHQANQLTIELFGCPADPRVSAVQTFNERPVSLTSYLGVEGNDFRKKDGLLFHNSRIRLTDVRDGLGNTLLAGERPPSFNFRYGWWYAGNGQNATGSADMVLGVRELAAKGTGCPRGPHRFGPAQLDEPCRFLHFWSLHRGGAHFLVADGAVRFLTYDADPLLPALATRAGREVAQVP